MPRTDTNKHMARLATLESMLKSGELLTVAELARALAVSTRTLQRDINILRERGLPIDTDRGRGGGVRLHRSWGIGRLNLTDQEAIDLLISLAITEKMSSTILMQGLQSIRYKVMALLSPEQKLNVNNLKQRIKIGGYASPQVLLSFESSHSTSVQALNQAFLLQKRLAINYTNEKEQITQRIIEPHYFYLNYPVWYILAWDQLRQDYRTFRCDRIQKAQITDELFSVCAFANVEHMIKTDTLLTP